MKSQINPYLLFVGGTVGTFLLACLFIASRASDWLVQYQPVVVWTIFIGFFAATIMPNKYAQLLGWAAMTLSSGFRFPIFFSVLRGTVSDMLGWSSVLIVGCLVWSVLMVMRILGGRFKTRPDELRIVLASMAQFFVAIMIQTMMFASS